MLTRINIDADLLAEAMAVAGLPTKKATVEEALKLLIRVRNQRQAIEALQGIGWEGDLDEMRQGRVFPPL